MIEADFRREYRIDLARELPSMSWRSFGVLLAGLSPDSRWAMALRSRATGQRVLDDPAAAEAYFKAIG